MPVNPSTFSLGNGGFIRGAFAEGVAESGLSVGRGNGKSTLVAGLGAASLDGPLSQSPWGNNNNGCFLVLTKPGFAYDHMSGRSSKRSHDLEGQDGMENLGFSQQKPKLMNRSNGAVLGKCLGSGPEKARPRTSFWPWCLRDEPTQWEESKSEAMIAALEHRIRKARARAAYRVGYTT